MITKKHYNEIALLLRVSIENEMVRAKVVKMFCDYFKKDNPRFDRDRFQDACFDFMVRTGEGDENTCSKCGGSLLDRG